MWLVFYRKKARQETDEYFAPSKGTSLLSSEIEELSGIFYRPRTRETKASYEILLSFIQQSIGDQVRNSNNVYITYHSLSAHLN